LINKPFWCSEEYLHKTTVNTFWNKKQNFNDPIKNTNNCSIDKDEICNNKCHTKGVLLTAYNCGIVCSYREIISSESLTQVSQLLLDTISHSLNFPNYLIYDNTCHLSEYIQNYKIGEIFERGKTLKDSKFVIDRLHIKIHVRVDSHKIYNIDLQEDLLKVNIFVCEELKLLVLIV
jgi:hypothetical protein